MRWATNQDCRSVTGIRTRPLSQKQMEVMFKDDLVLRGTDLKNRDCENLVGKKRICLTSGARCPQSIYFHVTTSHLQHFDDPHYIIQKIILLLQIKLHLFL